MRMCCSRGDLCAGSLGTLFEYQRRILNGATFRTRAETLQLRSSSGCKRCILNASLMLRTSGCRRYTLKVACRLNVRAVSSQSRPRCMVDQPTCEAVKVPILSVLLAFTDHPTPKTLGYTLRSHGCLHSSLPLLSAAYASAPRVLCVHPSAPITPSPFASVLCRAIAWPGDLAGARFPRNSSAFSHFLPRA
jgi:hypothetical protein